MRNLTAKQEELWNAANEAAKSFPGGIPGLRRQNRAAAQIEGSREWAALQVVAMPNNYEMFTDEFCQKLLDCLT